MITYTYHCSDCVNTTDIKQRITDNPILVCPDCSSDNFRKVITSTPFILKGSDFPGKEIRSNSMARA